MTPHSQSVVGGQSIPFSQSDFRKVSSFARQKTGISLDESKRNLLYSRITRRMRDLGIDRFEEYFSLVEAAGDQQEMSFFISLLTTNVTSFFREIHHFDLLRKLLATNLLSETKIRIWSAGCSTGQEAYSIAYVLNELMVDFPTLKFEILATDIDEAVLSKARDGNYAKCEVVGLSADKKEKMFYREKHESGVLEVRQSLKDLVNFRCVNLVDMADSRNCFDYIFCRNVVIYFDRETQSRLWCDFHRRLNAGGVMFLGQAERLSGGVELDFDRIGQTTFRKKIH